MEKAAITTHEELKIHIAELREIREAQGLALNDHFREFVHSISPFEAVKSSIHELVADKGVQLDLVKGGLNLGANFIIERIFNKDHGVKGFISSTIIEKVSSPSFKPMPQVLWLESLSSFQKNAQRRMIPTRKTIESN
jgi:hypothetical protein